MRNIRHLSILLYPFSLLGNRGLYAQEHEFGLFGGITNSFGDINNSVESMQFIKPAAGAFYRFLIPIHRIGYYLGVAGGQTFGYDSISHNTFSAPSQPQFQDNIYMN